MPDIQHTADTTDLDEVRNAVQSVCARFPDAYWLEHDRTGEFPSDFVSAIAAAGWLGICMPEALGGAGLGMRAATVMMQTVARGGGGMSAASAIHMNIFGLMPVVVFGNDEQKARMLTPLIEGRDRACFAVTEPGAGLDTTRIKTRAVRDADGDYVVHGQKVWISTAQVANKMLLLARTTPIEQCGKRPQDGLSLFYTNLDRRHVDVREIDKMGRSAVDSNEVFFDGLRIPAQDRIGDEGRGFEYILHGLNPERMLIAAEAIGLGRLALDKAVRYANERTVFGRPIGQNQAIQHPLAERWMALEAADLMVQHAADLYDRGLPCGLQANSAKFLGAEAGYQACLTAVMTHGGMGYAKEYHVERYLRESLIPRIAPVSPQLILCNIAERALGLPKSY